MSVPYSLMTDGYAKTLAEQRHALTQRITNATNRLSVTPTFHKGSPDPSNLPDETLGVWLTWDDIGPDPDEPNTATMLMTTWHIYIVAKDEENDSFGSYTSLAEAVWGDILKTLTETNTDLGLDGSCDFVPTPRASHFEGTISGGDRRVEVIESQAVTRWQAEIVRCPP